MDASLRFRVASLPGSLDLTIRGPYFFQRGQAPDWAWQEFYLNGVKWKGKTIPKLPILQPDKVTTLPLDIRPDRGIRLRARRRDDGRRPPARTEWTSGPKATVGDKPIYRGTAWIDRETFALLRRESIQLNLKGDTLSNVQTEYYREVPGQPRRGAAARDLRPAGLLDGGPHDGDRAQGHHDRGRAQSGRLRDAAQGGLRLARRRWSATPTTDCATSCRTRPSPTSGRSRTS